MAESARFISPLERALYLKRVEPLESLGPRELALLARYAKERFYPRGETVLRTGDVVRGILIVVNGRLRVSSGHGDPVTYGPSDSLGFLHAMARVPSVLDVVAEEDTLTLEIEGDALEDLFEDNFGLMYNQMQVLMRLALAERKQIADGTYLSTVSRGVTHEKDMGLIDRVLYLKESGVFRRANLDALVTMARRLKEIHFAPGETLWRTGDPSGFTYVIVAGTVEATLPDGRRFRAGEGYPLGNLESQCGETRWYDVRAENPVTVFRGDTGVFMDILEDHFGMALDFFADLSRNYLGMLTRRRQGGDEIPPSGAYTAATDSAEDPSS